MCGLYNLSHTSDEVAAYFDYGEDVQFPPRDYVAPGQPAAIVRREESDKTGVSHFALVRWGFVPSWAKEVKPGKPLINARSETIMEKPSFRNAYKRRRCLVPASGFYEWLGDVPGSSNPTMCLGRMEALLPLPASGNTGWVRTAQNWKAWQSSRL